MKSLAQIGSRLNFSSEELVEIVSILKKWVLDKNESKILRVNSLQSLFEICKSNSLIKEDFNQIVKQIKLENVPSLDSRIKKLGL